ncbi:MAG: VWA domain-containing protein [Acidimicrobiaceae bacterium]|nr:VWA domain-containing protein [Acidimicrobiaceae bacterium]
MTDHDVLDDQLQLLPFYLVADQSGSMESDVEFLSGGLQGLVDEARSNSLAYSKIRLTVLGFGSTVTPHLELADLRSVERMPVLQAIEEYTRYDLAFQDLRVRIERDVDSIKAANNAALRPAVFFLTDGKPNPPDQPWQEALQTLRDEGFRRRPNIVAFGVRDADPEIIKQIATRPDWAFVARERQAASTADALRNFIETFAHTVVSTGTNLASGKAELPVAAPPGFMALDSID